MKAALPVLILVSALVAAPRFGQTPPTGRSGVGSIEVLIKGPGGSPLDDVDVTLSGAQAATSTTGQDGRAVFRNLMAGSYQVAAERPGYMAIRPDGVGIAQARMSTSINSASTSPQVRIVLTQGAVLTGRVQDVNGRPVLGMKVSVARPIFQNGQRVLTRFPATPNLEDPGTDDLGAFRIFWLPPGEYFVLLDGEVRGRSGAGNYNPTLYYPGTTDFKLASRITLLEGQEARADFILLPDPGVTVSGAMTSVISDAVRGGAVHIRPALPGMALPSRAFHTSRDDGPAGQFEIHGVPPGSYDLFAVSDEEEQSRSWGRARIEVGRADIPGIAIGLQEGSKIRGRFSISADVRAYLQSRLSNGRMLLTAGLESIEHLDNRRIGLRTGQEGQEELAFSASGVIASRYRLTSVSLPPDSYLSDVRQNGRSVYDDGAIEVGRDPVDLEFVINGNGAVIEGGVAIPASVDVPLSIAVVLIPDKPRRGNVPLHKRAEVSSNSDASLTFTFRGVAPGSYRILACDYISRGDETNPDFIAQYEQRGTPVIVTAGARVGVQVELIRAK